jgi:tetratricopeptide (TPR) repeat protein
MIMAWYAFFVKTHWNLKKNSDTFYQVLPICILLAVSILAIYWQVVDFDFINFDDPIYIKNNDMVREGITLEGIKWAFTSVVYASNWHPLTWISHMIDVQFFGMRPGLHHLTNVIIHLFNAILLFIVFQKMTGTVWKSAAVAALFALHPLHVESVAWISERKDVLSTFFWMLTMMGYIWYLQQRNTRRYLIMVFFYILGLLSKPMLVTLPFVLLLMDFWPLNRLATVAQGTGVSSGRTKNSLWSHIWQPATSVCLMEKIPLIVLATIASGMTIFAQHNDQAIVSLGRVSLGARIMNAITSYVTYLEKMVLPLDLAVFYPYLHAFHPVKIILYLLILILVTALVLYFSKRIPYLIVGWFWYLGSLIPVIGIVQVGDQSMADRYTYIPLIGIAIIVVWGLSDLFNRWRYGNIALWTSSAAAVALLMWSTWIQAGYWKNSEILFRHALDATKDNYLAHYDLGIALYDKGEVEGAIAQYQETLQINPHISGAHTNLGNIMFLQGNPDQAINHYQVALQLNPHQANVYYNLGTVYYRKGNMKKAIASLQKAIIERPDYPEAIQKLGIAQNDLANQEALMSRIRVLMKQEPVNPALYVKLGDVFRQQEDYGGAVDQYQKALSLQPQSIQAMYGLVFVYSTRHHYAKALNVLQNIRQLQPNNPEVYYNIACIYAKGNKTGESIAWLNQAIDKGFKDWDLIKKDRDLENIRNSSYVIELMKGH